MVSDRHDVRQRHSKSSAQELEPNEQGESVKQECKEHIHIKCGHCQIVLQAPADAEYFTCGACKGVSQIPPSMRRLAQSHLNSSESMKAKVKNFSLW
jgi:hypothetical protein